MEDEDGNLEEEDADGDEDFFDGLDEEVYEESEYSDDDNE